MKRLVFIVEGDTEIIMVNKLIIPFLRNSGFNHVMHPQTIVTNRKQHKKGGVASYGKFKNEITRTFSQGNVIVTSFVDYYKLPTDFPCYTSDSLRIEDIEKAVWGDFGNNPDFIPYIQRHEVEALMFAHMDGFDLVIDDPGKIAAIQKIMDAYTNPEDINNSEQTAPSKRLESIFNYDKTSDGELIFEMMDIGVIMRKCPRFAEWIDKLVERLNH